MRTEEWINEFAPQTRSAPTTVLHASNLASAPSAPRETRVQSRPAPRNGGGLTAHPCAAMCVAGVVGFLIGRTVIR